VQYNACELGQPVFLKLTGEGVIRADGSLVVWQPVEICLHRRLFGTPVDR
jgi:hypothetical protein